MSIINEKMTAIADEIRTLSGTTGTMGLDAMASTLNTENTSFESNLNAQDNLISQIQAALEGKTGGSSGGGSVDTCTVTITSQKNGSENARIYACIYTSAVDGEIVSCYEGFTGTSNLSSLTLNNVLCGSTIAVTLSGTKEWWETSVNGVSLVTLGITNTSVAPVAVLHVPIDVSGNCSAIFNYTD